MSTYDDNLSSFIDSISGEITLFFSYFISHISFRSMKKSYFIVVLIRIQSFGSLISKEEKPYDTDVTGFRIKIIIGESLLLNSGR